ncbi:MAG: beta-ketoacyl-ACP synthase II [Candidatus Neomarinimicrobiota bacterium]
MRKRVVVTGLGVISPVGNDVQSFWSNILQGRNGVARIESFDPSGYSCQIAAEVRDFDPLRYFSQKDLNRMDRVTQFGAAAARQAVEDSGLMQSAFAPERVGVIVGSGIGGISTLEAQHQILMTKGHRQVSPFFIPMMIPDIITGRIAIDFGFCGPNYGVTSACATASHAIGVAYQHICTDDADVMITGGTEAGITPLSVAGFSNMKSLSRRNDAPQKASRPFDRERDGFVIGEGAGIVVIEELEHALRRNAKIYAEVVGYGFSADAYHITAPHPEGKGAVISMERAIRVSGLAKKDFNYINAHGTSTQLNDRSETLAIKTVFGEQAYHLHISSTKSMTGHLLGAAGGIEFIILALALQDQIVPPTTNYEFPDPECDLNYTPNIARKVKLIAGLSNNFGFGGHNAVVAAKVYSLQN